MSVLTDKIRLVGSKGSREVEALFDGGASYSFIRKDIATEVEIIVPLKDYMEFELAETNKIITVKERIISDFYLNNIRLSDEFLITDNLSEEVIIGAKTMQAWRIKLDFDKEKVIVDPKVTRLILK